MDALGLHDFGTAAILVVVAAAFIAGLARGFSGFGAALIFVPLASTVISPVLAAPLLLVVDAIAALPMIPTGWRLGDRRETGIMALGAIVGTPVGAWVLIHSEPLTVRWMIAGFVVALLALVMSGWRYHGQPAPPLTVGVGAMAGVLNGIAQVGGPPVIAYWLGSTLNAERVRANIILYFALSTLIAFVVYAVSGLFVWPIVGLTVIATIPYALGLWCGAHMFGFATEETFRRICYALIAVAAAVSLPLWDGTLR